MTTSWRAAVREGVWPLLAYRARSSVRGKQRRENGRDADGLDLSEIRTELHFPHLDGIIGYPVLKQFEQRAVGPVLRK